MINIRAITRVCIAAMLLLFLALSSIAELEQTLVPINAAGKKITLTLFHFDSKSKTVINKEAYTSLAISIKENHGLAGVSVSEKSSTVVENGQLSLAPDATYLIKNNQIVSPKIKPPYGKHTFLISNGKGEFAIGYVSTTTRAELNYALKQYFKANNSKYHTAIQLATGNTSGFYKDNGQYHAYYLKELNPVKQVLIVK